MKRKFEYAVRTIDDEIVRDGLSAISKLDINPSTRDIYAVRGGVAVQSYLPTTCRRPTTDIDTIVGDPLKKKSDFIKFVKPVVEYLQDNRFIVNYPSKESRSWLVYATLNADSSNDEILLSFSRDSEGSYNSKRNRRERELENARIKTVEEREEVYRVLSTEDIITQKFQRLSEILKDHPDIIKSLSKYMGKISDELIRETMNRLRDIREKLLKDPDNRKLDSTGRAICDAYDIRILFEISGINEQYLVDTFPLWPFDHIPKEVKKELIPLIPGVEGLERILVGNTNQEFLFPRAVNSN